MEKPTPENIYTLLRNKDEFFQPIPHFDGNPERFESKMDIACTIIFGIVGLVFCALAYWLWFHLGSSGMLMLIVKIVCALVGGFCILVVFTGGSRNFFDRAFGGRIDTDFLVKAVSAEHTQVREWYRGGAFDQILALPVSSTYYNKDLSRLWVAHNPEAKILYFFCEYQEYDPANHGNVIGKVDLERLSPVYVCEPEYSRLLPMIKANILAVKEVESTEEKEQNITVTPKI